MKTQTAKLKKLPGFITEVLDCKWSNLLKPDTAFGDGSANHNITVVLTEGLQTSLDKILKQSGAKKINGIYAKEGVTYLKTKSRLHVEAGKFPCVDAKATSVDVVPFGGDKVKLMLAPAVVSRDNSLSLYLNGIQIIEKNSGTFSTGFTVVDGGFTAPAKAQATVETVEDDELPF